MSISPEIWGPYGWSFIHYVALGYPEEPNVDIINRYRNFFISLGDAIPCEKCQKHYKQMLLDSPPQLENQESLFRWTVDIHNQVNRRLNKPTFDYKQAYDRWMNLKSSSSEKKETHNTNSNIIAFIIVFIVLLALFIVLFTQV